MEIMRDFPLRGQIRRPRSWSVQIRLPRWVRRYGWSGFWGIWIRLNLEDKKFSNRLSFGAIRFLGGNENPLPPKQIEYLRGDRDSWK